MTTTHNMNLNSLSFARIKDGSKVIELRLNDEKRQLIQIGDTIIFKPSTGEGDSIETQVIDILPYPSFAKMIDDLPVEWFGNPDREALKKGVYEHYTVEDEKKNGVLGIRIKTII